MKKLNKFLDAISLIMFIISLILIVKYCTNGKYIVFGFVTLTYVFTTSKEYIIKGVNSFKEKNNKQ